MLVRDYAITPDVFDVTCYSNEEVCGLQLAAIREVMMSEGLVRDLRAGEWRALFASDGRSWHRHGKELVKKLATQGRLIRLPAALATAPADDCAWCAEALATHAIRPLTGGVVVTQRVKDAHQGELLVAAIDRLSTTPWWTRRSPSARPMRSLAAYQEHLDPILRCANSLVFIDPHLDPGRHGYREFAAILERAGRRTPAPAIEIHRVCWEESRDKRAHRDVLARIESSFRSRLLGVARSAGVQVDVFFWDDFHDRFLISNLVGISLSNGFDTTSNPNEVATWSRLGRTERDDIQREFDPASGRHALLGRFRIP
jgi:hypothetical protein